MDGICTSSPRTSPMYQHRTGTSNRIRASWRTVLIQTSQPPLNIETKGRRTPGYCWGRRPQFGSPTGGAFWGSGLRLMVHFGTAGTPRPQPAAHFRTAGTPRPQLGQRRRELGLVRATWLLQPSKRPGGPPQHRATPPHGRLHAAAPRSSPPTGRSAAAPPAATSYCPLPLCPSPTTPFTTSTAFSTAFTMFS